MVFPLKVVHTREFTFVHPTVGPSLEEVGGVTPRSVVITRGGVTTIGVTIYSVLLVLLSVVFVRMWEITVPVIAVILVTCRFRYWASEQFPSLRVAINIPDTLGHPAVIKHSVRVCSITPWSISIIIWVPAVIMIPSALALHQVLMRIITLPVLTCYTLVSFTTVPCVLQTWQEKILEQGTVGPQRVRGWSSVGVLGSAPLGFGGPWPPDFRGGTCYSGLSCLSQKCLLICDRRDN